MKKVNSDELRPEYKRENFGHGVRGKYYKDYMSGTNKEEIAMPYTNYTPKEVSSWGEAIYEQQIRNKVEAKYKGKFLVIDIETGEYEIDADDLMATKRLLTKRPDAILYGLRIGFPSAYRIGKYFSVKEQ
jgi:hypothetical protein